MVMEIIHNERKNGINHSKNRTHKKTATLHVAVFFMLKAYVVSFLVSRD
jgi:hypothetical protein